MVRLPSAKAQELLGQHLHWECGPWLHPGPSRPVKTPRGRSSFKRVAVPKRDGPTGVAEPRLWLRAGAATPSHVGSGAPGQPWTLETGRLGSAV